jgi:hypothetical protein
VYSGRSLPDTWNSERQLNWHPELSYPLTLESNVRRLAYWKHWNLARQLISINKLESGEEQHYSIWKLYLLSKMDTGTVLIKITGVNGPIRKIKKTLAVLGRV